jgi:hypothetical protein
MYLMASDKKASTICTITHCAFTQGCVYMTKGNLLSRFSQLFYSFASSCFSTFGASFNESSSSRSLESYALAFMSGEKRFSKIYFIDMSMRTL